MTKPVVSLLATKLIEQGRLRLYDMVAQYDSRFAQMQVLGSDGSIQPANRLLTVEDLLTHRAGMTYEFIHGCHVAQYYREARINADGRATLDDMMQRLSELPLAFQPGTQLRYSVSIDVLAQIIERATGQTLDVLLHEQIFAPLGMTDTAFHVPSEKADRVMPMYGQELLGVPALTATDHELVPLDIEEMHPLCAPDTFRRGGLRLYSTLRDYLAFARMLLDGKTADRDVLVSRKMLETVRANRIPPEQLPLAIGPNVLHGYGWGLIGRVMLGPGRAMSLSGSGEYGWAGAATTYFWSDPDESMYGVIMSQYLGATLPMTDDMRNAAYQALAWTM